MGQVPSYSWSGCRTLHIQSLAVIKSYCHPHFKNEETETARRSTNCSEDTPPGRGRIRTWIQTRSCHTTRRTEFGATCLQTKSGDQKSGASSSAGCKRGISPRGSRDLVTSPHVFVPPPCSSGRSKQPLRFISNPKARNGYILEYRPSRDPHAPNPKPLLSGFYLCHQMTKYQLSLSPVHSLLPVCFLTPYLFIIITSIYFTKSCDLSLPVFP